MPTLTPRQRQRLRSLLAEVCYEREAFATACLEAVLHRARLQEGRRRAGVMGGQARAEQDYEERVSGKLRRRA